ncbi:hypothetical protein BaRGS_00037356, partial [Batillaria attramentaria]
CGFDVTVSGTVITSPGFPDENYPNNADCQWNIMAPEGAGISIQFTDFRTEFDTGCDDFDFVVVFDGDGNEDGR